MPNARHSRGSADAMRAYAKAAGVTLYTARKHRREGHDGFKAWWAKHCSGNRGTKPPAEPEQHKTRAESLEAFVRRCERMEILAASRAEAAGDGPDARSLAAAHATAAKVRIEAEGKLRDELVAQKDLVPKAEMRAGIAAALLPIKKQITMLPKVVAIRCNPSDPATAEEALDKEIERILVSVDRELADAA